MTEGPANPHIVAVVVTFNRLALVQRLVARLAETEGLAEVLVVDNASTDGTGEWLAAQSAPVRTLTLPTTSAARAASTSASSRPWTAAPTWSG